MIDCIILCGGRSSRFNKSSSSFSHKFLEEIQGKSIINHVIDRCTSISNNIILSGGFRFQEVMDAVHNVTFVDSGVNANTAERVLACESDVQSNHFILAYADSICDINLSDVYKQFISSDLLVTVVASPIVEKFGVITCEKGEVVKFTEKPARVNEYKSCGFFICDKEVFNILGASSMTSWEREFLPLVANLGQLNMYNYTGNWHCVDTTLELNEVKEFYQHE
jgi:NDP-sugar pyrophosphorylase family protein